MVTWILKETNMRRALKSEEARAMGAIGLRKKYEERRKIIEKLQSFGGIQGNYRLWSTEQLKILLKAWTK